MTTSTRVGRNQYTLTAGRNLEMITQLRTANPCWSGAQIAHQVGLTRERVRQICRVCGLPTRRPSRPRPHCSECGKQFNYYSKTGLCQKCLKKSHMVPLVCDECGVLFERRQAEVISRAKRTGDTGDDGNIFCSKQCQGRYIGREYGWGTRPHRLGSVSNILWQNAETGGQPVRKVARQTYAPYQPSPPFWLNPKMATKASHDYILSGAWQCPASPTGAHQWQLPETGKGDINETQEAVCACCGARSMMMRFFDIRDK